MTADGAGSPELIAQHLTSAGEFERAIAYWAMAGSQAGERYANREAVVDYERALQLLAEQPKGDDRDRLELDLRIATSRPLLVGAGFTSPAFEQNALRIVELARAAGDDANLWPALYELGRVANQSLQFGRVETYAREMLRIGERLGDDRPIVGAIYTSSSAEFLRGRLHVAQPALDRGLGLKVTPEAQRQAADHFQAAIGCRSAGSWVYWSLGQPGRARRLAEEALAQARALDRPFPLAYALQRNAIYWQLEHAIDAALGTAQEFLQLHSQYPAPHWVPWVLFVRAWAAMREGRLDAAIADLDQAWPLWHARRSEFLGPYFRCLAAEVHLSAGHLDRAQVLLDEAFAISASTDQHHWAAELHRVQASLVLARDTGGHNEAERQLEAALAVAREPVSQEPRASGRLRSGAPLRRARRATSRPGPPRGDLRLVHRGIRHVRFEGRQNPARGAGMTPITHIRDWLEAGGFGRFADLFETCRALAMPGPRAEAEALARQLGLGRAPDRGRES